MESIKKQKGRYHHGDLASALVAAARTLVERDGIYGFSVSDACKLAGVSTAAPYKHFKDRDDILSHVARVGYRDLAGLMKDSLRETTTGTFDQLVNISIVYVDFALSSPETFRLMFATPHIVDNDPVTKQVGFECFLVLCSTVAAHVGKPYDDPQTRRLTFLLWTFTHGTACLMIDQMMGKADREFSVERLIRDACAGFFESKSAQKQ